MVYSATNPSPASYPPRQPPPFPSRRPAALVQWPSTAATGGGEDLIVWDPITGDRQKLDEPHIPRAFRSFTVLCAGRGCDHRSCYGGPFLVVCVGTGGIDGAMHACVYSSEAGAWGAVASLDLGFDSSIRTKRGTLIRGKIYMTVWPDARILEHDLGKHRLSVIEPPDMYDGDVELMAMEDGSLGLVGIMGSSLYLWLRKVNPEGTAGWVQWRVIELEKLFPIDRPCKSADVIGFAEGVGVIFLSTDVGTFTYELKSGQVRKVMEPGNYSTVCPFMSFFTPDCASGRLMLPAETH